jgi:hypothetical protein
MAVILVLLVAGNSHTPVASYVKIRSLVIRREILTGIKP